MKILSLFCLLIVSLHAEIYYAKVEPLQTKIISSNVNGQIIFLNEKMIGHKLSDAPYIIIDSKLNHDELNAVNTKIMYTKKTLYINEKMLENLHISLEKKKANYQIIQNLKIKSTLEKDKELYAVLTSENLYLSTQKEMNSLEIQVADLELRRLQLLQIIKDKNLQAKGLTLHTIDVKVGQVVNISMPLATLVDTSKAILSIYLNEEDILYAKNSTIFIDNTKTKYKIVRINSVADAQNISKYKAQIIIDAPKVFSKLVKIELKASFNE